RERLSSVFSLSKINLSSNAIQQILNHNSSDNKDHITFMDFIDTIKPCTLTNSVIDDLALFRLLDVKNMNYIDIAALRKILTYVDMNISETELEQLFFYADFDKDSKISEQDFRMLIDSIKEKKMIQKHK
ncbi:unnamed protein product, partial [Didymodactylos carnosus]